MHRLQRLYIQTARVIYLWEPRKIQPDEKSYECYGSAIGDNNFVFFKVYSFTDKLLKCLSNSEWMTLLEHLQSVLASIDVAVKNYYSFVIDKLHPFFKNDMTLSLSLPLSDTRGGENMVTGGDMWQYLDIALVF